MDQIALKGDDALIDFSLQDPFSVLPHGDRLLIEVIEISENYKLESGLLVVKERLGETKQETEFKRGWKAGIVLAIGNGHRLNAADQAVVVHTKLDPKAPIPAGLTHYDDETKQGVVLAPARVPMPWGVGNVVAVERLAGRDLIMQGKLYCMVDQEDVLCTFRNLLYQNVDGSWHRFEPAAPQAEQDAA